MPGGCNRRFVRSAYAGFTKPCRRVSGAVFRMSYHSSRVPACRRAGAVYRVYTLKPSGKCRYMGYYLRLSCHPYRRGIDLQIGQKAFFVGGAFSRTGKHIGHPPRPCIYLQRAGCSLDNISFSFCRGGHILLWSGIYSSPCS